jgi:hypothetical protein
MSARRLQPLRRLEHPGDDAAEVGGECREQRLAILGAVHGTGDGAQDFELRGVLARGREDEEGELNGRAVGRVPLDAGGHERISMACWAEFPASTGIFK